MEAPRVEGSGIRVPQIQQMCVFLSSVCNPASSTPRPVSAGESQNSVVSWGDRVPYAVVQEEMSGLASAFLFLTATSTAPVLPLVLAILQGRASCRGIQARVPLLQGYQGQSEGKQVCGSPRASSKAAQAGAIETCVSHARTPSPEPCGFRSQGDGLEPSDVVSVVQIRWVQPIIMPLAPLLDGLAASLFLFWGTGEAGSGPHTGTSLPSPPSSLSSNLSPDRGGTAGGSW